MKLFKKSAVCAAVLSALAGPVFAQQVIIGAGNNTPGAYTIVVGNNNTNSSADGHGYFIGSGNNSTGNNVAIGDNNTLTGNTVAGIGLPAYVIGSGNVVGADAANIHGSNNNVSATADSANVMGDGNTVSGVGSVTIGTGSTNTGQGSSAIGNGVSMTGVNSIALGGSTIVSGTNAGAIGGSAQATADGAYAIGTGAVASQANAVALGSGSTTGAAIATTGVTLLGQGYTFAGTAPTSTVSVGTAGGERTVTNVAAGRVSSASTDAINGSQLAATNAALGTLADRSVQYDLNPDGTVNRTNVTMAGPTSTDGGVTGGTTITNIHQGAVNATSTDAVNGAQIYNIAGDTSNTYVTQNGRGVRYVRTNDTGLPLADAHAQGQGSSALGYNAVSSGQSSLAMGNSATASGQDAIATGSSSTASGTGSIAMGAGATAAQNGAIALGAGSTTSVGVNVAGTTLAGNAYTFAGANGAAQGTVSVGAVGAERQIQNVAAGQLTATSTDAVNGSQLFATNTALNKLNDRAVQYDLNTDGTVNYTNVSMAGPISTDGGVTGGTTITNIHQGAVNATSTDAVNGAQLYNIAGDTSNTYVTQNGRGVRYVRTNDTGLPLADAHAQGQGSSAMGYNAVASGKTSLAMGNNASASATNSIATGTGSTASGTGSIALGAGASASQNGAIALGAGSKTIVGVNVTGVTLAGNAYTFAGANGAAQGTVSVGAVGAERQIQNVAAGQLTATSTDAVNGSQLFATNTALNKLNDRAVQYDLNTDGTVNYTNVSMAGPISTDGGVTGGTTITNIHQGAINATSTDAVNGAQIYNIAGDTSNTYVTQNGRGVRYVRTNDSGLALSDSSAQGVGSSAMGYNAVATGDASLAMGFNSSASGQNAIATGTGSVSSGNGSIALGAGASASQDGAVALGAGSVTGNGVDVGGATIAGNAYAFAGNKGSAQGTVSVGAVGAERQVQNVAAGQLTATSTDAVNGSQLFATNTAIDGVNSHVNVLDGRVTVIEGDVNNLYQITGNLDGRTTVLENTAVRYDVRQDGSVNYNSITLGGTQGNGPTAIHNLADGVAKNDAVNKGQLDAAKKQLGAGVAVGVAMSGLTQANDPDRTMITAATGVYGSDFGIAAGASRMFDNGRVVVKGGVGLSTTKGAKVGIAVGAGMNL